jgi:hypothetical protein
MRALLKSRSEGEFVSVEDGKRATADMIAEKKAANGL